jgi:hypothetical protein
MQMPSAAQTGLTKNPFLDDGVLLSRLCGEIRCTANDLLNLLEMHRFTLRRLCDCRDKAGEEMELQVTNTADKIPEEDLGKIFEPLSRAGKKEADLV